MFCSFCSAEQRWKVDEIETEFQSVDGASFHSNDSENYVIIGNDNFIAVQSIFPFRKVFSVPSIGYRIHAGDFAMIRTQESICAGGAEPNYIPLLLVAKRSLESPSKNVVYLFDPFHKDFSTAVVLVVDDVVIDMKLSTDSMSSRSLPLFLITQNQTLIYSVTASSDDALKTTLIRLQHLKSVSMHSLCSTVVLPKAPEDRGKH